MDINNAMQNKLRAGDRHMAHLMDTIAHEQTNTQVVQGTHPGKCCPVPVSGGRSASASSCPRSPCAVTYPTPHYKGQDEPAISSAICT
ncbi:jg18073 [Pararge aegeria aegeria]|uniref:Jg18073 protein n=1 Tax=Pararge aegeria aegeria TaxID=348720 RepID=A0A8S4RQL1_9NEOP|nr:jg18073 [Pararge aegeria aegeria]